MITAVDTNILIDIFIDDKKFGALSAKALNSCLGQGAVVISGVVLVEITPLFPSATDVMTVLNKLQIRPNHLSLDSYFTAARIWKEYQQDGGTNNRVVADFLIGAHAQTECDRLLTRDRGFYRRYFKKLTVLEPS